MVECVPKVSFTKLASNYLGREHRSNSLELFPPAKWQACTGYQSSFLSEGYTKRVAATSGKERTGQKYSANSYTGAVVPEQPSQPVMAAQPPPVQLKVQV